MVKGSSSGSGTNGNNRKGYVVTEKNGMQTWRKKRRAKIPDRNEKRFKTARKRAEAILMQPQSAANAAKLDELWDEEQRLIKKARRQAMVVAEDKDLLNSRAAAVTLRNVRRVEGKRMRKLQQELPMILERGLGLHNENNLAFVTKILGNLI